MITPHKPQHNDTVERNNRSILNMAKSMLKTKQVHMHLWDDITSTAVYINDKYPTKKLNNKTTHETCTTKKIGKLWRFYYGVSIKSSLDYGGF